MKTFTSSDLKQNVGDVLMAAAREPVSITKHDKARYVLMDVSLFSAAPCSHSKTCNKQIKCIVNL